MARERQQKYFEKDWIKNKENISIYFSYNSPMRVNVELQIWRN